MITTHMGKLRTLSLLKWVSFNLSKTQSNSSKIPIRGFGALNNVFNHRFYGSKVIILDGKASKITRTTPLIEAQVALMEYLHSTRCLQFTDAEHMSKNSPHFLNKLLRKVENEPEIGKSLTRLLRYHPINEFEPFFESLGLNPGEYAQLLPRDLIFLSDDMILLENYHFLCNYGIPRRRMGKIFKEAREVFGYDYGVLNEKIRAYEELGLGQSLLIKIVVSSPRFLVGDGSDEAFKVLEFLKNSGFDYDWIEPHLSDTSSYNWKQMLKVLCFFKKVGWNKEQLGGLIDHHPEILFVGPENGVFSVIGFLLKFGLPFNEICSMFLKLPQIHVSIFLWNLRHGVQLFKELDMEAIDIGKFVRTHPILLGSCALKKSNSLLSTLNIGKKRLCIFINENPNELKNWVYGKIVKRIPNSGEDSRSQKCKLEFLLGLGYVENSDEMKKAIEIFRGKGWELCERFECFLKAGLERNDVIRMVKVAPQILNQSKDVLERKIDFLRNGIGCPLSTLIYFPGYMAYTTQRVNLRFSMYTWLKEQGCVKPYQSLSSIIACSEDIFLKLYVNKHPRGSQVWENLKREIYSDREFW